MFFGNLLKSMEFSFRCREKALLLLRRGERTCNVEYKTGEKVNEKKWVHFEGMTKEANDAVLSFKKKEFFYLKCLLIRQTPRPLSSFSYLHILCILCACVRMNERMKMM